MKNKLKVWGWILLVFLVLSGPNLYGLPGDPDLTFSGNAKISIDFSSGGLDEAYALAPYDTGRLIVAGQAGLQDFAAARLNADGSMDSTFGTGGKVTIDISGNTDYAMAVVVQPDGKILLGGEAYNGSDFDFALARLNPDGTLDSSFGTGGKVEIDLGSNGAADLIAGLALDASGKIYAAGYYMLPGGNRDFAIARFDSSGNLDTTFNSAGSIPGTNLTDFFGEDDQIKAITIQSDGKILAAGSAMSSSRTDFALARYNTDGTLDTATFNISGTPGKVTTDLVGLDDSGETVALQADGQILVGGFFGLNASDYAPGLIRYNTDGTLDVSFGTAGIQYVDFGNGSNNGTGLAIQPDGKILLGGIQDLIGSTTGSDFVLLRFETDGSLDSDFGTSGISVMDFNGQDDKARAILLEPHKRIILAGSVYDSGGTNQNFGVAAFYPCLFCDDFEDAVLATDWTYVNKWSEVSGNLGNIAESKSLAIASPVFASLCSVCSVEAGMSTAGGAHNQVVLIGWYSNKGNHVSLTMKQGTGKWILRQVSGGTVVAHAKASATILANTFYDVKVDFDGAIFRVYVDDTLLITMSGVGTFRGTVGFAAKKTSGLFQFIDVN